LIPFPEESRKNISDRWYGFCEGRSRRGRPSEDFAEANVREGNVAASLDIVNNFNTLPWGERGDGIFPDAPLLSRLKTGSSLGYEDPKSI